MTFDDKTMTVSRWIVVRGSVQQGGTLSIEGSSLSAGAVTAGQGLDGGGSGSGYGNGIFLQGTQTITLGTGQTSDQTTTISGVIADQTGSGGSGTKAAAGSLIISGPGTVALDAINAFTGGITIQSGTLILGSEEAAGSGDPLSLNFSVAKTPSNTIVGFAPGDTIDITNLNNSDVTSVGFNDSTGQLTIGYTGPFTPPPLRFSGSFRDESFSHASDGGDGTDITLTVTCFVAGTRIRTERGDIAVELLRVGDRVRTVVHGQYQAIVWTGHRRIDCTRHPKAEKVHPVRISAHSFGAGLPRRDLRVSPDHAIYVDGSLIPVKYLMNGKTVVQIPGCRGDLLSH
jgi:autotransporter-associated beta strand protein